MGDDDAALISSFARVFLHGGAADAGSASLLRHLLMPGSYAGDAVSGPPMPPGFISPSVQDHPRAAAKSAASKHNWPGNAWNASQQQHYCSQQAMALAPVVDVAAQRIPRLGGDQPQMPCKGTAPAAKSSGQPNAANVPAINSSDPTRSPPQPKQAQLQVLRQVLVQPVSPPVALSLKYASPAVATGASAVAGAKNTATLETPAAKSWPREQGHRPSRSTEKVPIASDTAASAAITTSLAIGAPAAHAAASAPAAAPPAVPSAAVPAAAAAAPASAPYIQVTSASATAAKGAAAARRAAAATAATGTAAPTAVAASSTSWDSQACAAVRAVHGRKLAAGAALVSSPLPIKVGEACEIVGEQHGGRSGKLTALDEDGDAFVKLEGGGRAVVALSLLRRCVDDTSAEVVDQELPAAGNEAAITASTAASEAAEAAATAGKETVATATTSEAEAAASAASAGKASVSERVGKSASAKRKVD